MASGASSLDSSGSSTNGTLPRNYGEHGSARDYDGLKAQCDKAMHELQMLRRQHSETGRRCDHAVKELEYYRGQHRAAMAQLEAAAQETSTLRTRCADLAADKQRLERDADIRLQESLCGDGGSGDFMSASARKHDALKDDYETLRKRCEDLVASHAAALAKLELAQEEANRAKKQCDEVSAERGAAVRERNGLKQQCTAAIRQWDIALRERNEYREALGKVQQQHEEAVKEINQAMAVRMKASKDLKRLAEERNAAMQEYSLIMSERDTVHKEMEKLSDDLAKAFAQTQALEAANKQLADEKKAVSYQQETLRREIASALTDRDKALKECNDLREKFGELSEESARDALGLDMHALAREREGPRQDLAGTEALAGSRDRKTQRERVDDLDLANLELERMRKQLDKLVAELLEASQEAEVSKRRRDWAFCERDKIVLERESIRTLCDRLRKERDRAVSDLAEALRDSDDLKKQRNDTAKELTDLRERVEAEAAGAFRSLGRCDAAAVAMMDPASDTDDWNTEVLDIDLSVLSADQPLGLSLSGGRGGDGPPVVSAVAANSPAAGRLLPGDRLVRVNNLDCSNMSQRVLLETVRSSGRAVSLVLRRPHLRRAAQKAPLTLQTTRVLAGPRGDHGLTLSAGVYVSGVAAGSPSAQAGLCVGQRVVSLDGRSMDGLNSRELAALLAGPRTQLTLQTLGPAQPARDLDALDKPRKDNANTSLKMVHRCSQTEAKPGGGAEGKAGAWEMIREKIEIVTGRGRPWKGREAEEKALLEKKRMSSPGVGPVGADPEDAIAELDHVIESYHRAGIKRSRRRQSKEKSGGTWPKSRSGPLIEVGTGTIIHPRKHKERLPLSVLLNDPPVYPRSRPARACPQPAAPALCGQQSFSPTSFAALLGDKGIAAGPSETSIDLGSPGPQMSDVRRRSKYASDSESPVDSLASASRVHSALYGGPRLASFPHPHPHPRSDGHAPIAPLGYASSRSGDSGCDARGFCFEPPYSLPPLTSGQHSHSPTAEAMLFHKTRSLISAHSHPGREDPALLSYQPLEGGTFPRQRESPRIRIPSNQSVASKGNKVSSGSIERGGSERNSPMPTFHVEVLSPGHRAAKRNSLPDYCFTQNWRPAPGELRRVHIDKSVEPLGIQISCIEAGGVFVSTVNEHSLASQVGLQVGDQLLEVCGINMRSATYQLAANVLRQCGNSITMLVQYSPDKYHELDEESGGSSSEGEGAAASRSGSPTPCNSPAPAHKRRSQPQPGTGTIANGNQTSTLSRQKPLASRLQHESVDSGSGGGEPRALLIETRRRGNLGISLVGGNAVGIFVHSVQADSLAHCAGLRTGDQILEYNGTDLRHATAEEAAYELAKPADKVTLLAHYKLERYHEIKDKPGDGFYVRTLFDRTGDLGADSLQLRFRKDNVLFVDNTMFNGVPGSWRAWFVDEDARRQQCGIIPSKYKVEEELLLRRSLGDLESEGARRGTTSARRSFFRRKKPVRGSSRDSKELASFSSTNLGWYSDSGALGDELALCSYQRVERLDYPAGHASLRPVLVLGALADCVQDKLLQDFPDRFSRCVPELMQCPLAMVEKGLHENLFVDYRKKGAYFECTTLSAVKEMCDKPSSHCVLDVSLAAMERLHRHQIYPIVLLIKFKSTKQVKEVKDTRFPQDKVSAKAAKEMYEHALKIEAEYKHYISAVIPAGVNVAYMCTQIKAAVDAEQNKTLWVPCGTM